MDMERLCNVAMKATLHTLRYHGATELLDTEVQTLITEEVHELYHLRSRAEDTNVADLEIACDAAISVAEAYNKAFPNSSPINIRWFYHCVQSLLLIDVLPAALLDGKVDDRLPRNSQQSSPGSSPPASESNSFPPASSPAPSPTPSRATPASFSPGPSSSRNNTRAVLVKPPKSKWEHEEIQRMVELKASGMRHCEVATILGRGQGAVENKYGRVMHDDQWKSYSSTFEATLRSSEGDSGD